MLSIHCRPIYGADYQALSNGFSQKSINKKAKRHLAKASSNILLQPLAEANGNESKGD